VSAQRNGESQQRILVVLSIVAAVAEAHGGSVAVRSQPGHGSTFRIVLPLSD
jgi:signal transduction histidine kinase